MCGGNDNKKKATVPTPTSYLCTSLTTQSLNELTAIAGQCGSGANTTNTTGSTIVYHQNEHTTAHHGTRMLEPNATLYIKNIDWKIKKGLLKRALYSLFTRHGKVLEVVVLRREGLRGQAWVIFQDVTAATAALQKDQGFTFFGKDMMLEYAKEKSDRIAKRDGTYVPKAKRKQIETLEAAPEQQPQAEEEESQDDAPPSKYLLAQDLPPEVNEMMFKMLFQQYAGFVEVRMPRPGLAFVEFQDEPHATLAKKGLHGFKLTATDTLRLTYGKA